MGRIMINEQLAKAKEKLGIGQYERHVFLCAGPRCCSTEVGEAAWDELKNQITDRNLLSPGGQMCYRTRVGCLRVCTEGPTAVVYPEGTWYHGLTADKMAKFVDEHLVKGAPVKEWVFAENELPREE
jgi:(2Fe-2S) ferredoxin